MSPLERAVAQALIGAGRLQPNEAPQLLAFAQSNQLLYKGSHLCAAMIRAGRLRADEADQILAAIPAPASALEIPLGGTLRMAPGSLPLPIPGQPNEDEASTRRHDSARLARELAAADADIQGTLTFPSSDALTAPTIRTGPGEASQSGTYPAPQRGTYPAPQSGVHPAPQGEPPASRHASRLVRSDLLDDGEATFAFDSLQAPGPRTPPSSSDGNPRPGDMTPGGSTPGSGVFGVPESTPSGSFGASPGSDFGASPGASGAFGASPGSAFGASPGASGAFGGQPSGAFGAQPSGAFGAQPSGGLGTYGGQSSSGSTSESGGLELNLEQLGLTGARYTLEHRPAPGYWEAQDSHLERKVVLRVAEAGEIADDPFWRHARILALLDQASVREVHDLGVLPGRGPFYCLDPIEGVSLEELISSEDCPPLPALLRALIAVCASLQHAHEHDLVHVRLTPSLVRLGAHGQVYVAGWETAAFLPSADAAVRKKTGDPPPIDPGELKSLAPELRKPGARLSARTDVHALGRLLYWILTGRPPRAEGFEVQLRQSGAPRELVAVAGKALSEVERERYPGARHFADDLRRFLDGKAVLAERDPPLRAALRLARRYPAAAGVGALVSAVVLAGALITYQAVRARADRAQDAMTQAGLAAEEAELRREDAETQLALAKERSGAGKIVREFEATLREARGGGRAGLLAYAKAQRLVKSLEARPKEGGAVALARSLRLRLLLARGRDRLYTLDDPHPSKALDDFEVVAELAPEDPRGHFLVFEAARRLPGAEAAGREQHALNQLKKVGGTWADLAGVGGELNDLEARARTLASKNPPEILLRSNEVENLQRRLDLLCGQLGDVSQARTWRGRLGIARTGPRLHRSTPVRMGDLETKAGAGGKIRQIWTDLFWAILLDPTDPEPRAAYTPSFFAKWGAHSIGRHKGGWPLGSLATICRRAERPGPSLALSDLLTRLERIESTQPLLERALALPDPQPPRDPFVRPRLELALARARLKRGQPQPTPLSRLSLPPGYEAEVDVLECWTALANGSMQEAYDHLGKALKRLQQPGVNDPHRVMHDLAFALSDPRPDPNELAGMLRQMVPPAPPGQAMHKLEGVLRLGLLAQLSRIPERDANQAGFQELQRIRRNFRTSLAQSGDPGMFANLLSLYEARLVFHAQPNAAASHLIAISTWSALCHGDDSSESLAAPLRDLVVQRLRKLGNTAAAEAFALEEPVDEFVPRRAYTAPEIWDWKGRRGESK